MDLTPMQYVIFVTYASMFIMVFYFASRIAQLKRRLENAVKTASRASEDMTACYQACTELDGAVKDHRTTMSDVITTIVSRNVYLEISLFREIYGVWELNSEAFEYHIQEVLMQLLYYRLVTTISDITDFNEMFDRAKRLSNEKWVQERFMEKIQHPDNLEDLIDNPALASGDLALVDACIREVLVNYPEENPTVADTRYIRC